MMATLGGDMTIELSVVMTGGSVGGGAGGADGGSDEDATAVCSPFVPFPSVPDPFRVVDFLSALSVSLKLSFCFLLGKHMVC